MEQYVLMAICFGAWAATTGLISAMMRDSEHGFIIGALLGLLTAAAAGGAYYQYLSACRACI